MRCTASGQVGALSAEDYVKKAREIALDIHVESEPALFTSENELSAWRHEIARLGPFQQLDAVATCDADATILTLAVINRDREQSHETTIQFADATTVNRAVAYEVNGPQPESRNSFAEPSVVAVQEQLLETGLNGQALAYTFPAHSLTILQLHLQ